MNILLLRSFLTIFNKYSNTLRCEKAPFIKIKKKQQPYILYTYILLIFCWWVWDGVVLNKDSDSDTLKQSSGNYEIYILGLL